MSIKRPFLALFRGVYILDRNSETKLGYTRFICMQYIGIYIYKYLYIYIYNNKVSLIINV